jgi:hypothetical protein
MCPLCITTAALSAAGATSGMGVITVAASKWRTLQRWFMPTGDQRSLSRPLARINKSPAETFSYVACTLRIPLRNTFGGAPLRHSRARSAPAASPP